MLVPKIKQAIKSQPQCKTTRFIPSTNPYVSYNDILDEELQPTSFFYRIKQYNTLTFWIKNEPTHTELKKKSVSTDTINGHDAVVLFRDQQS